MQKVYVLVRGWEYEGSGIVVAFSQKPSHEELKKIVLAERSNAKQYIRDRDEFVNSLLNEGTAYGASGFYMELEEVKLK